MYLRIHLFWCLVHVTSGHDYFKSQKWLSDNSTCEESFISPNFHGQIYGTDYCTGMTACRSFAVFKCNECGTTIDKIEVENPNPNSSSKEPQNVIFAVTCYVGTKKICGPIHAKWSDVESTWFKHCPRANRTKRFVPACGAVGAGGWNRPPPPPLPFFGEPMLPPPPMRPSPCQAPSLCRGRPCGPCGPRGCGGPCGAGGCGGGVPRAPPPPMHRPCGMGGPCGGNNPPARRPPHRVPKPRDKKRRRITTKPPVTRPRPPVIITRRRIPPDTTRPTTTTRRTTSRTTRPWKTSSRRIPTPRITPPRGRPPFNPTTTSRMTPRTPRPGDKFPGVPRIPYGRETTRTTRRLTLSTRKRWPPPGPRDEGEEEPPQEPWRQAPWRTSTKSSWMGISPIDRRVSTTRRRPGPPPIGPAGKELPPWLRHTSTVKWQPFITTRIGWRPMEPGVTTKTPDLLPQPGKPNGGLLMPPCRGNPSTLEHPCIPSDWKQPRSTRSTLRPRPMNPIPREPRYGPWRGVSSTPRQSGGNPPGWEQPFIPTTSGMSMTTKSWRPGYGPNGEAWMPWIGSSTSPPHGGNAAYQEHTMTTPKYNPEGQAVTPWPPILATTPIQGGNPQDWNRLFRLQSTTPSASMTTTPWLPKYGPYRGIVTQSPGLPLTSPRFEGNPPEWGPSQPITSGMSTTTWMPKYGPYGEIVTQSPGLPLTSPRFGGNPPEWERPSKPITSGVSATTWWPKFGPFGEATPRPGLPITSPRQEGNPPKGEHPFEPITSGMSTTAWGPEFGPVEEVTSRPGIPTTPFRRGGNPPDWERPTTTTSWPPKQGPNGEAVTPWPRYTATSTRPGWERPFGLQSTTSGASAPTTPWRSGEVVVQWPWQTTTSPWKGGNAPGWQGPFEPKTSAMATTPWRPGYGPEAETTSWRGMPTTSPKREGNTPEWAHPVGPQSATTNSPGIATPWRPKYGPGGDAVTPWPDLSSSTRSKGNAGDLEFPFGPTTTAMWGRPYGLHNSTSAFPWQKPSSTTILPGMPQFTTPWIGRPTMSTPGMPWNEHVSTTREPYGQRGPSENSTAAGQVTQPETPWKPLGQGSDNRLGFKLSELGKPDPTDEIFSGIKYEQGMDSDIFASQLAERCKTLAYKKPPDIQTAKLKNNNSNVDEGLVLKQLQLRRDKQEMWCTFVKDMLEQRKKCDIDRTKCKKVTELMPGGIKMDVWISNDNSVQNNPRITDNSMNININSNNNGPTSTSDQNNKNAQYEAILRNLVEIQMQQKQIQQQILDQIKHGKTRKRKPKKGKSRKRKPGQESKAENNLTLQRNILDSRSRTQLISEAKSKIQILIAILSGLKKEMQVMNEKKAEYSAKLKTSGQLSSKSECESVIDYVSESDLEHHKMIKEFETLIVTLNSTIIDLETHHQGSGQQIGQQTFSTFVYYLQEASNTIKLFNQNHQLMHNNAESHVKNSNAKNIVHNIYQFVYVKGKADCDECLKSAKYGPIK